MPPENDSGEDGTKNTTSTNKSGKGAKARVDDEELGGEVLGTMVWDEYEHELKIWEAAEAESLRQAREGEETKETEDEPPTVDTST